MSGGQHRDDELLTREILARTSGPPCAGAHDRLVGFTDGELSELDADLVRMHLAGCTDCAALGAVLRQLPADLPLLAELQPDPRFVADVMARTRAGARPAARAVRWAAGVLASGMRRPRFAWEAAYVATFVLALVFGVPGSPLAGVPQRALELARVNPVVEVARPTAGLRDSISRRVSPVWNRSRDELRRAWSAAEGRLGTLWQRLASEQGEGVHYEPSKKVEGTAGEND